MGKLIFTLRNPKKRRWVCQKNKRLVVEKPEQSTISKTRKKVRTNRDNINKMSDSDKKSLLVREGVINSAANVPSDIVDIMFYYLL
tara:strand:- start:16247 stop:16504 length:258 start_codon:yes stop_codon:yes gene_type:complete